MLSSLLFDLRQAVRSLGRHRAFTLVVVGTLAVGIGANTAMFSLIHATLLKPLPYKDPDRLVLARRTLPGVLLMWNSAPDWYDYRDQTAGLETLAGCGSESHTITVNGSGRPERLNALQVSSDLLSTLGVSPVAGRGFTTDEARAGAPYAVVVSERVARRWFGSAAHAVGKSLTITGVAPRQVSSEIVGVLPSTFRFLDNADLWAPIRRGEDDGPETRRFHNWVLVGRLRPGVSAATVQTQLDVVSRRLQRQYPETNKEKGLRIDPLQGVLYRDQTPRLMVLMGAVGLVLLIACANVAGMLLTRGVARRSELAVRAALGASGRRIAAQLIGESLVLSGVAGLAGVALAIWLQRLLPVAAGLGQAGIAPAGLAGEVLAFAVGASLLTGLLCGLVPALRAPSSQVAAGLAPGARSTESREGARLRSVLVSAQVALSLVLLIGAGLLVRSLSGLMTTDLGFDARNLLTTSIDVPVGEKDARLQFQAALYEDLRAIPGVSSVAFTTHMPIREPWGDPPMYAAQRPPADSSQERTAFRRLVTPGFFSTMGMRLIAGRDLLPGDRPGTPRVLVINDVMAREFFPGENPIGQRVIMPGGGTPMDFEVVGVVRGARTEGVGDEPAASVYGSINQTVVPVPLEVLVRTTLPPEVLAAAVRRLVSARNPEIAIDSIVPMDAIIDESLGPQRVITATLTSFSVLALLLAALGLYGVLTHYVTQRTHEIGVRVALGAGARHVTWQVLSRSAVMVLPGLGIGAFASLAAGRLVSRFLYGVPAADPATFAGAGAALAIVAVIASVWPAWRATRIDPVRALRGE